MNMDHPRFVNSLTGTHFATNWGNGKQTEKKIPWYPIVCTCVIFCQFMIEMI